MVDNIKFHFTDGGIEEPDVVYTEDGPMVMVIHIPNSVLTTNAKTFGDFRRDNVSRRYQRILQTFAHLVQNSKLCEEVIGKKEEVNREETSMFKGGDGQYLKKTKIYLERVDGPDGESVGWRFFIFVQDPKMDFGRGIDTLIEKNKLLKVAIAKIKARSSKPTPTIIPMQEQYRHLNDREIYFFEMCDVYFGDNRLWNCRDVIKNPEMELFHMTNPANPLNVYSLKEAMEEKGGVKMGMKFRSIEFYQKYDEEKKMFRYTFPNPDNVFLIENEVFHANILHSMEFPSKNVQGNVSTEKILSIMQVKHRANADVFMYKEPSDMALLAETNAELLSAYDNMSEAERGVCKRNMKRRMMEVFRKVWNSESKLSKMCCNILKWYEDEEGKCEENGKVFTVSSDSKVLDTALSPFANLMAGKLYDYEKVLHASTCHRELLIVMVARLDAYRRSFDLHTNPLLTGSGSSSKSYILNCTSKMSIPDTIQITTHETSKANAIDEDQNDIITFFHEMPLSMLGFDGNGAQPGTGDPTLKDRLTSCTYRTKMFHVDEDTGKRSNRTAVSEIIGVMGGCTNDAPSKIPEALRSRFAMIMCPNIDRPGYSIVDFFAAATSDVDKNAKKSLVKSHQMEQFLTCLVEKLIWVGILENVNMSVANIIFIKVTDELYKKGISSKQPRQFEILKNTARTLTIMYAIDRVFNDKKSPVYGKQFDLNHMFMLEPYLICTEEIAYFSISLLQDMYVNSIEKKVIVTLGKLTGYVGCRSVNDVDYRELPGGGKDMNYVKLNLPDGSGSMWSAAHCASQHMKNFRTSPENILHVLSELRTRHLKASTRLLHKIPDGEAVTRKILELDRTNKCLYILAEFLDLIQDPMYDNIMQEAIRTTFHKHSRPRSIILGETNRDNKYVIPYIFKTIKVKPIDHLLSYNNPTFTNTDEQHLLYNSTSNNHSFYVIDNDLEEIHWSRHMQHIGYSADEGTPFLPENIDNVFSFNHSHFTSSNVYPKIYLRNYIREAKSYQDFQNGKVSTSHSSAALQPMRPTKRFKPSTP